VDGVSAGPVSHARMVSSGIILDRVSKMLPADSRSCRLPEKGVSVSTAFLFGLKSGGRKKNGLKYKSVFCRYVRKTIQIFLRAIDNILWIV
jgi:hypothetical protein